MLFIWKKIDVQKKKKEKKGGGQHRVLSTRTCDLNNELMIGVICDYKSRVVDRGGMGTEEFQIALMMHQNDTHHWTSTRTITQTKKKNIEALPVADSY
jgi:hypothetical protein